MDYEKIYDPSKNPGKLMRVFGLFSGGASSLRAMADDSNRDNLYNLAGTFTNNPGASGIGYMKNAEIPVERLSYRDFCKNGCSREEYFEQVARILEPYDPDIITLSGFMLLIPTFFLRKYWNRILNVHPADLAIMTGHGVDRLDVGKLSPSEVVKLIRFNHLQRKFVGDNAVYDAVMAGEEYTKSTIHIVRAGTDTGPIVVQSREFLVDIPPNITTEDYSSRLQKRMKWGGDGPVYLRTLELLALGRLGIGEDDITILLDGLALPYRGHQLSN